MDDGWYYFVEVINSDGTTKEVKKFEDCSSLMKFIYNLGFSDASTKIFHEWSVYKAEEIV